MVTPRSVVPLGLVVALLSAVAVPLHALLASETQAPLMPEAWRNRVLRIPPGYEALQPSDVVIGFAWKRGPDGFSKTGVKDMVGILEYSDKGMGPGSTPDEAQNTMAGTLASSHVPRALVLRGSDLLGKVTVGWTAFVRVAHFMPFQAGGHPTQGAGFVYGAASLTEALEQAAAQAIAGFRSAGGSRFETVMVEAGVSAKPDYNLYKHNGTFGNISPLPFMVRARFPEFAATGPAVGHQPQFPQEAKELVRWLLAPEQKGRMYGQRPQEWFGLSDAYNLLKPGMALPVFLTDIQDAEYRPESSLSPAERQQRDDTAQLAREMYQRSQKVPSARDSALQLMLEAAKLGHVESQYLLGAHQINRGVTHEERMKGLPWLSAAAGQGSVPAKHALIDALLAFEDVDPARALREMESLANGGHLRVFSNLAWVYREGRLGLKPDLAKAVEFLERGVSFAGDAGDSEGYRKWLMDELAVALFRGDGTTQDRARAARLFRESAMEGQIQASPGDIYRAYFYATGEHGFPRDPRKALELLNNLMDGEWKDHQAQARAIRATVEAAFAASTPAPATPSTAPQNITASNSPAPAPAEPTGPHYALWRDHAEAVTAIKAGNYRPGTFLACPSGTAGAPGGTAKVVISVLLDSGSRVVDARVVNSSNPSFNSAALARVREADFTSARAAAAPGPSLLEVTALFRPAK